jgi:hypothetical protein
MIAVDFETYYSKAHTVSTLGPWAYAHHTDTDIYMVSVVGEGISFVGDPKDFDWSLLNGKELVSHNAAFDMVVCRAGISRGIIDLFAYKSWSCSADLMAYIGYPRALANACKQSFGVELPKVMRNWMSGKRWEDAVAKGKDKQLLEYALNDSVWCLKLWEKHEKDWPAIERQLSSHTRQLIWRGVNVDDEALQKGIVTLQSLRDAAETLVPWKHDGAILSLPVLRDYCSALGVPAPPSLAKDSEECAAWEDIYGDKFPWIAAIRDYRRTNMLLCKLNNMSAAVRTDGTMPVYLKYWGAHPGRWSGAGGVNLQNMPRGEMYGVNMRHMMLPKAGNKFVISDLAQIEPRVLHWFAKDKPFLDRLAAGESLYEVHARSSMGWAGGKLKVENPGMYQFAKARELGLGYGCGVDKFVSVALSMAGLVIDRRTAKDTVYDWRGKNRPITSFWSKLNNRLEHAKNNREQLLEFDLPSGRTVKWWHPRPDHEDPRSIVVNQTKGMVRNYTWGGKMTENVVQALSRDIFAHHLLEAEKAGISVTWSIHDELVCDVPTDQANDALDLLTRIMSTPPEWISDIPLAADGSVENHYTK